MPAIARISKEYDLRDINLAGRQKRERIKVKKEGELEISPTLRSA
jgi:hypothetical protein